MAYQISRNRHSERLRNAFKINLGVLTPSHVIQNAKNFFKEMNFWRFLFSRVLLMQQQQRHDFVIE